jgi:hypothetical protein
MTAATTALSPEPSSQSTVLLLFSRKEALNVFNHIQPLFSIFVDADPLLSIPSSLFSSKQGVGGYNHAPEIFWCQLFALSAMFSAKYELFALFCNVDPLFSSLYELFP